MEFTDLNMYALGQAIDSSWGRSSTPKTASYSVKFSLQGNCLIATYNAIVNFGTEHEMIVLKRRYAEESISIVNAAMKNVKKTYKNLCGESLKVEELQSSDSLEIIGTAVHNPRRTAYYRRVTKFELS